MGDDVFSPMLLTARSPVAIEITDSTILSAIETLKPRFRPVVLWIGLHEYSYKAASSSLRVPVGRVMTRLSRVASNTAASVERFGVWLRIAAGAASP